MKVASHPAAFTSDLRPLASDFALGGGGVTVDWLRMGPYGPTGTFTSRVLGAGSAGAHWQTLDAALDAPDGTAVTLETRSGATAAPDAGWSDWSAVGAGGAVTSPAGRYVQYRATLTGGTDLLTPTIDSVTISATADRPPAGGGTAPPADSGTTIRQTPTAGAPAGTTAPSAPAPAAPKPTGGDVAGATATSPAVRALTATRSVALRTLARRGLVLRLVAPSGTRSLDVRLYRVATKRVNGRTVTRRTRVLRGAIAVRHGGRLTVRWRPRRADLEKLRSGRYVLRIRAGRDRSHLAGAAADRALRLTGARVSR